MRRPFLIMLSSLAALFVAATAVATTGGNPPANANANAVVDGTLRTWHGDTTITPIARGAGIDTGIAGVVELADVSQDTAQQLTGRRVRGVGRRSGNVLAVGGGGSLSDSGGAAVAAITGDKRVAVILFNFSDAPTVQPWTAAAVRGVLFDGTESVNRYYQDTSYGQMSLSGDVFGYYTIPSANSGCDWRTWGTQARNAATAAGDPIGSYQYVVYAFPSAAGCGWAGLAYLPGTESWINNAMSLRVVSHELGHNFGTHHASTYACGAVAYAANGCSTSEYGDPYTVMGGASKRLHTAYSRADFGHLTDTRTVTTTGSHTIAPVGLAGATPRQLKIARGDGTYLFLDFRQPAATFDVYAATDNAVNGVQIRFGTNIGTYNTSKLLDLHPGSAAGFGDAALTAGESWLDPVSGVSIAVVSVSPAGANVTVSFTPDGTPPSIPGNLQATPQTTSVALSWSASTDNSGSVAGYRIKRNGAQVAEVTGSSWTDTGLASNTPYAYEVRAFDAAGNESGAATASTTTLTPDTVNPTAPTNLLATPQKGRKVQLSWGGASDAGGIAGYRVYRNGVQVAQVATLTYRDSPGRGTHSYVVRAVDVAGNLSDPSNTATARI